MLLPDEIIQIIIYNLENIYNCLLTCKKFNNLIDWETYFEHRTNKCILSLLDRPINVKTHKYFMNIKDNIMISQVIVYYSHINNIIKYVNNNDICHVDITLNDGIIRFLKEYRYFQLLKITDNITTYFNIKICYPEYLYKIICEQKIKGIEYYN